MAGRDAAPQDGDTGPPELTPFETMSLALNVTAVALGVVFFAAIHEKVAAWALGLGALLVVVFTSGAWLRDHALELDAVARGVRVSAAPGDIVRDLLATSLRRVAVGSLGGAAVLTRLLGYAAGAAALLALMCGAAVYATEGFGANSSANALLGVVPFLSLGCVGESAVALRLEWWRRAAAEGLAAGRFSVAQEPVLRILEVRERAPLRFQDLRAAVAVPALPVCQVCGRGIEGGGVRCDSCQTPHHADCWEYVGRCSTYGCGSPHLERRSSP